MRLLNYRSKRQALSICFFAFCIIIHLLFYISAWHSSHFLNIFFPIGQLHRDYVGLDFFQVPQGAWEFFRANGSLEGTSRAPGSWSAGQVHNNNVYHPFFTMLIGGVLQLFTYDKAVVGFQIFKLLLTCLSLIYVAKKEKNNPWLLVALGFFLLPFVQYHEIKIAQYQHLLNISLLFFLLQLVNGEDSKAKTLLTISLFIKPSALGFAPLFVARRNFRPYLWGFVVFILCVFPLQYFNAFSYYWSNLIKRFTAPIWVNYDQYSLGALLLREMALPSSVITVSKLLVVCAIFALALVKRVPALVLLYGCAVSTLCFDNQVYEYHYSILIPFFTVGILREPIFRNYLSLALIFIISLPSLFVTFRLLNLHVTPDGELLWSGWPFVALSRLLPPILLFAWLSICSFRKGSEVNG